MDNAEIIDQKGENNKSHTEDEAESQNIAHPNCSRPHTLQTA